VVFVDVEPFDDERDYPSRSAFAGYSAGEIGELAANWVATYLDRGQDRQATVLIVSGTSQNLRQEKFKAVISDRLDSVNVIDDDGEFVRSRARDVVQKHLEQFRDKDQRLHVIFCTSDEMALGAVDALYSVDPTTAHRTAVVGVDGTPEARALIDTRTSPLRATVVQDSYELAEHATDLLVRLLGDDKVAPRTMLRAKIYSRE
jgi:ribose transport system substrate-binding protein